MKKYSFIKYLVLLACLLLFVVLSTQLSIYTHEKTLSSYNALPHAIASYFIYIIFGIILGIESLLFQKKYVKYSFNATKFVLLSLPFFILGSIHLIVLSGLLPLRLSALFFNAQFVSFCQTIFGYGITTNFFDSIDSTK